jgi:DNA repair exonuclease SbcCD nuclease subunit
MYFDKLAPYNVHMIIGNHDIFHRNSLQVNSVQLVLGEYDKLHFIDHPQELEFDGLKIAMIPWICADNKDETVEFINNTSAPIAMGHLELAGFAMYKGVPNAHGEDPKLFANFESVYSGHYHHRSSAGNINYLGAPLEYTWSDYDDPRGFHVFDTETRQATFVQNPLTMFKKIFYDDSDKTLDDLLSYDFEQYRNCVVKIVVKCKNNPYWFDQFIDGLEACSPYDLQVVEDHLNLDLEEDDEIVSEAEGTLEIFQKFIEQAYMGSANKSQLNTFIGNLYQEALSVETV